MEELKKICEPIIKYIKENYNPHTSVIINDDYIKVVSDEVGIPLKEEAPVAVTTDTSKIKELISELNKIAMQNANTRLRI